MGIRTSAAKGILSRLDWFTLPSHRSAMPPTVQQLMVCSKPWFVTSINCMRPVLRPGMSWNKTMYHAVNTNLKFDLHVLEIITPIKLVALSHLVHLPRIDAQVKFGNRSFQVYIKYLGDKGDWPWLRSSHRLNTGFNCRRIGHLCDGVDF